jgi:hypothetical protein
MPTEIDTSSFKLPVQVPIQQTIQGWGAIEQQKQGIERQGIGIEADKLKLANERFALVAKEMTTLMNDPTLSVDKIHATGQNLIKMGIIPPETWSAFTSQLPRDPTQIRGFLEQQISRAQTIQEAINYLW